MMKVLNFGSLNLDYVYRVDHFVAPGETLDAISQTVSCGGKGLNQSIALARAGAKVWHAGCLGTGGERLLRLLAESGVNTDFIRPVDELQGNAVIQVNPQGENCILLFGGSNRCITKEQVNSTLSAFSAGDYLVLQNEINNLPFIVDTAFERGMNIVLNPSPCDEKLESVDLGKISWLLVNEIEAEQLSGKTAPEAVRETLHKKHPGMNLLVTLGKEGSMVFTEKEIIRQEAYPVVTVDTTGAGDTFTGYFVAGLVEGRSLKECMRRAAIASAISVTRHGAAKAIPESRKVDAFTV